MKQILLSKRADKFLEKLSKSDKNLSHQISEEIELLQESPINSRTKKSQDLMVYIV